MKETTCIACLGVLQDKEQKNVITKVKYPHTHTHTHTHTKLYSI